MRAKRNDDNPIIFFIFIGAIVVVIAIQYFVSKYLRRKRAEQLEQVANEFGLEYSEAGGDDFTGALGPFNLFTNGRAKKVLNLIQGTNEDRALSIFDYQYTTGAGKSQRTWRTTVLSVRSDGPEMPQFLLRKKTAWDSVRNWFRGKEIEFEGHPNFSRFYRLIGENEPAIRELFNDSVLEYCERNHDLQIEGAGQTLLYYRLGKKVRPDKIGEFLAGGLEFMSLLNRA
jgi:hypothetical protein